MIRRRKCCPCCGHPYSGDIAVTLPAMRRKLFEAVDQAGVDGVPTSSLMNALYGDRIDGGPESPNIIRATVLCLNRDLARLGLKISGQGPPRGFYRLLEL